MTENLVKASVGGANQAGLRDHNERLLLSLIRDYGPIAARDLARQTSLSAQTVSVILRELEGDDLLQRGEPVRGKVGKPLIPMSLSDGSLWSVGIKLGRRSVDVALMDLRGAIKDQRKLTYRYPEPGTIFGFIGHALDAFHAQFPNLALTGIGLATPFEIWKWHETIGAPKEDLAVWERVDFINEIARLTDVPLIVMNDATAACRAENHFGSGRNLRDYAYLFVGAFIGGGVVLNRTVLDGNLGNAGALGSLVSIADDGRPAQLLDVASLHLLEEAIAAQGEDPRSLWDAPGDWSRFGHAVDPWLRRSARAIAQGALSACAVLDFEAVVIDGAFPTPIRRRLCALVRETLDTLDSRGLIRPQIVEGEVGENARVIGAAYAPISAQFFLDSSPILTGVQ